MKAIRTHLIDASALVKLVIYEEGSEVVREYLQKATVFSTTSLCFAEALGVLKKKLDRKDITQKEYLAAIDLLITVVQHETLHIDPIGITDPAVFSDIERMVKEYSLDVSDALQLVTLRKGFYSGMTGESKQILITGDGALADAAAKEGFRVWNCMKDPPP
jgi:predicted nucleic acid-binding protein